ncbi:MAG: PASTA domain-containing protein [Anaerolineales bacterium]|nr:PASTA domain-containing protein [Anaerolineales bacterium]
MWSASYSIRRADLAAAGLTVSEPVTTQPSSTAPAGSVISQNPPAGATVVVGMAVNLVVSSGPDGNETCGAATPLTAGAAISATLDAPGDIDFYRIKVTQPDTTVDILLYHQDRDYDLFVYADCAAPLPAPIHTGQGRHVGAEYLAFNVGDQPGVFYLKVAGYNGASSATPYTLQVDLNPDSDESNDHCYEALEMAPATQRTSYLSHAADLDFYKVRIDAPYSTLTVRLHHATEDYNLALFSGCVGSKGVSHVGESLTQAKKCSAIRLGTLRVGTYITKGAYYTLQHRTIHHRDSSDAAAIRWHADPDQSQPHRQSLRCGRRAGTCAKLVEFAAHPSVKGIGGRSQ